MSAATRPSGGTTLPWWVWLLAGLAVMAVTAAVQLWMGRVPIAADGTVRLWVGEVNSSGNSQHLSDWYTPSHVVHGFLFYALLLPLRQWVPLGGRAVIAMLIEAAWEVAENTDAVIRHYREATISLQYFGDSVLNAQADILAMLIGFLLAARLPAWLTVALAVAMELFAGWMIRDNLTLNVLMLLWPLPGVKAWQAGGG